MISEFNRPDYLYQVLALTEETIHSFIRNFSLLTLKMTALGGGLSVWVV
jgi:hypothetical protein